MTVNDVKQHNGTHSNEICGRNNSELFVSSVRNIENIDQNSRIDAKYVTQKTERNL